MIGSLEELNSSSQALDRVVFTALVIFLLPVEVGVDLVTMDFEAVAGVLLNDDNFKDTVLGDRGDFKSTN